MDRRKFLQFLGVGAGVAAVTAVAPGAVKFFLPPRVAGMTSERTHSKTSAISMISSEGSCSRRLSGSPRSSTNTRRNG